MNTFYNTHVYLRKKNKSIILFEINVCTFVSKTNLL